MAARTPRGQRAAECGVYAQHALGWERPTSTRIRHIHTVCRTFGRNLPMDASETSGMVACRLAQQEPRYGHLHVSLPTLPSERA